jgi:hypothetical protein
MRGNLSPHYLQGVETILQHAETLFPTFTEGGTLYPQLWQGVEPLFPHIYKVWNPYSPTFTWCGNLIPHHLMSVETSFTIHILKVCLIP